MIRFGDVSFSLAFDYVPQSEQKANGSSCVKRDCQDRRASYHWPLLEIPARNPSKNLPLANDADTTLPSAGLVCRIYKDTSMDTDDF